MTNSTLEKVARAIADNLLDVTPDQCRYAAIAALNVIRQVDDETVEAMYAAAFGRWVSDPNSAKATARLMFEAAISAILTEGGEG